MILSMIAALTEGTRVVGIDNKMPWHLPEDLKRFRAITSGHPIIMGRKTYDSIGRPLPKRRNIVITRQSNLEIAGCEMQGSLERAIQSCEGEAEVFIIGGGEIFREALPKVDKLYLTWIKKDFPGDAFFPEFSDRDFIELSRQEFSEPFPYAFANYLRK